MRLEGLHVDFLESCRLVDSHAFASFWFSLVPYVAKLKVALLHFCEQQRASLILEASAEIGATVHLDLDCGAHHLLFEFTKLADRLVNCPPDPSKALRFLETESSGGPHVRSTGLK